MDAAPPPAAAVVPGRDPAPSARKQQAVGSGILLAGVAALAMVDLLFAVAPGWSFWLLMGGVLLVGVGWLTLAVLGAKRLIAATAVVAVSYFALTAAAPATRGLSWRMLVWWRQEELSAAVRLLEPVEMERELWRLRRDPPCARLPGLRPGDCAPLQAAMHAFGARDVWKEGTVTVFETYLWVNARGGLMHCPGGGCGEAPGQRYPRYVEHVTGNWHRWAQ